MSDVVINKIDEILTYLKECKELNESIKTQNEKDARDENKKFIKTA